jgi:predicted nucleic acid-binding protein
MAGLRWPRQKAVWGALFAWSRSTDRGAWPLLTVYADTSVFVSLYLPDAHSREAQQHMAQRPRVWLTPLHRAEWTHAIGQHVFQRQITPREAQSVYRNFERDREAGVWIETGLPEGIFEDCIVLARNRVARLGVRTLDTLHVALALHLKSDHFWSFDRRQSKLAEAEGLKAL